MNEYILFLDESLNNINDIYFSVGGCIIEKNLYINTIIPYVENLKMEIWGTKEVNLHEYDIRQANGADYKIMRKAEKRTEFWQKMDKLFSDFDIHVMCAFTDPSLCKCTYNSSFLNNEYFMCLKIVLENYAHFLEKNSGTGSIFVESRNPTEDKRLQGYFFEVMNHGTLFLSKVALQTHITTLSFNIKSDNNIGLQVADFIPNAIKRHANGIRPKQPSITNNIVSRLYDGTNNNATRFGAKKIL